jgi:hypothetical protein
MGSMRRPAARARTLLLGLVVLLAGAAAAQSPGSVDFPGACYCRAAGQLRCTGGLTLGACQQRCDAELCDEWFWKERLPCWNWGYGG